MAVAKAFSTGSEERLFLVIVVVLALVAALGSWVAASALSRRDRPQILAPDRARQLVDFSLTDSGGRTVTRAALDGKVLAVSFLFTGCALTCPEVSRHMAEIQQRTAGLPDVRLVSLTVDPRTDTPAVLADWESRYGGDTNRWLMLTGSKSVLYHVIGTSFLDTATNDPFNSMPGNFTGTERIALVDRRGRVRAFFDGLQAATPEAVAAAIARLRQED